VQEAGHSARLRMESLAVFIPEVGEQDFDGGLGAQVQMLTQVDLGKVAPSDWAEQAIVSKQLSRTICQVATSSEASYHVRSRVQDEIRSASQGAVDTILQQVAALTILYHGQNCNIHCAGYAVYLF